MPSRRRSLVCDAPWALQSDGTVSRKPARVRRVFHDFEKPFIANPPEQTRPSSEFAYLGHEAPNGAVALVEQQDLIVGSHGQPQVGPARGILALRRVLLLDQLQHRLVRAVEAQNDAADRILAAVGQLVSVEVE